MLASTPWLPFNALSLMHANKGVFRVNPGTYVGWNRPHDRVGRSADETVGPGRD